MRLLTHDEMKLVAAFADKLEVGARQQLLDDLESSTVASSTSDGSRLTFDIARYERPPYQGQHQFAVEGTMLDRDGTELSVLLYADENGRLLELEFIRWDSNDVAGPQWKTLELHG